MGRLRNRLGNRLLTPPPPPPQYREDGGGDDGAPPPFFLGAFASAPASFSLSFRVQVSPPFFYFFISLKPRVEEGMWHI